MTSYEIVQWIEIDAAHRILKHGGKCRHLHGHRYRIGFRLQSPDLNDVGLVLDFGEIKDKWGKWLLENWDHGVLLQEGDFLGEAIEEADPGSKIYYIPDAPSAESLSKYLLEHFFHQTPPTVLLTEVVVQETPNCWASWRTA